MGTEDMAEIDVREIDDELALSKLAGNTKHLQSRLTAIELYVVNTKLTVSLYEKSFDESTALQPCTSQQPLRRQLTCANKTDKNSNYIIKPDIMVDLLLMKSCLPLMDALGVQKRVTPTQYINISIVSSVKFEHHRNGYIRQQQKHSVSFLPSQDLYTSELTHEIYLTLKKNK